MLSFQQNIIPGLLLIELCIVLGKGTRLKEELMYLLWVF